MTDDPRAIAEGLESYRVERAMLVAALEQIDRYARQATFGGWRHTGADITGIALSRAEQTERTRNRMRQP